MENTGVTGYLVSDKKSGELGPVREILEMPGQRILAVEHREKEVLIPFKRPILVKTDHTAKTILVNLPEGLLDIYLNGGSQE
jgi:16S rRNA processing protein RimM